MKLRRIAPLLALLASVPSQAAISLLDKDGWKINMGGFVELDAIVDSTRSFTEVIGNGPVARQDDATGNGLNARTQLSIRNSRLSFGVDAPELEGMKARGYFEFDLLGFNPSPGASNTESSYYNNPTFRARHLYLQTEKDGFQALAGQTWMLLGWQPYYFISTVDVAPVPGMLYGRTAQVRGLKTISMSDDMNMQAEIAVMRPPQRDSSYPGLEGGLRWTYEARRSGFTGGATGAVKTQPLSLAVSGALREFKIPNSAGSSADSTSYPGSALAVDTLIPVLASPDGKDVGGTLSLLGEFTAGTGYGDQFASWTGGIASPLSNSSAAAGANSTARANGVNLDSGIGDYDASGAFHLVHLMSYNVHLQYHLPSSAKLWLDAGYSRLYSDNVSTLVSATGRTSANTVPYENEEAIFANVFHACSEQLRLGAEYVFVRTRYGDTQEATDNRYQLAAWFMF